MFRRMSEPGLPARDELHIALAEQWKSHILQLFIDVMVGIIVRYVLQSWTTSADAVIEAIDQTHSAHSEIVAAVTVGGAVRSLMAGLVRRGKSAGRVFNTGTARSRCLPGTHR